MAAQSSVFFNGRVIFKPGSYLEVDASGLEQVGLGASGILGIIGEAEGGIPVSDLTAPSDFIVLNKPEDVRRAFVSGDLREACAMAFEPSSDPQILAGAQQIVAMKVNPASQSSSEFSNSDGPALLITTQDYGAFSSQINVTIGTGTNQGKMLTFVFEDTTEAFDDVGGVDMFTLQYTAAAGWEAMTGQVLSTGVRAYGSRADAGLDGQITAQVDAASALTVAGGAGDAGKTLTIYGRDASNVVAREVLVLDAGGDAVGTQTWNKVYGAKLSSAAVAAVEISDVTTPTILITIGIGQTSRGVTTVAGMYATDSTLLLVSSGASINDIYLWGTGITGAVQSEKVVLTGTVPVRTTSSWRTITDIVLGGLEAAQTLTISGVAGQTTNTTQSTLTKVGDYFNGRNDGTDGFTFTMVTGNSSFNPANLDLTSGAGQDIFAPADGNFQATLQAIIDQIDVGSQLLVGERITFAPMIRSMTATAVNGSTYTATINGTAYVYTADGSATLAEIQAGLIALINNSTVVNRLVVASVGASDAVTTITASTPVSFTLTTASSTGTLTNALVQSVDGTNWFNGVSSNTAGAVFLSGGSEGVSSFSDWQDALNWLKQYRVNSVIVLTGDPAVHAALEAHCAYMCGIGKSERDGFVGLSALDINDDPTGVLPDSDSIKEQIIDLNSRHIRAFAQTVDRFDTLGESTTFMPWFQATLGAAMQAGSPVGTSLTYKFAKVLDIGQHISWNPVDDAEEMIQGGLCFMESVSGVGRRFVRNITTHLSSSNLAYTEGSVNQAVNYAAFEFRNTMEFAVGRRGFAGTILACKGIAINKLGLLQDEGIIVQWRALTLELNADVLEVSVEIAPVIPINFVLTVLHLTTIRQVAA